MLRLVAVVAPRIASARLDFVLRANLPLLTPKPASELSTVQIPQSALADLRMFSILFPESSRR